MTDTTNTDATTSETEGAGAGSVDQTASSQTDAGGKGKAAAATAAAATIEQGKKAAATGESDAPWYSGLPDDLKGEKSILRHASLEDAIRAGLGAEKRLGVPADQLVRLPTNDDEAKALYAKLGAPETPEGYNIGLPKDATDADRAAATSFAKHMHEAGPFPPAFVKAAVDWNNAQAEAATAALAEAQTARKAEGEALLKKELGAAYDPEMKDVGKLLLDLGGQELADELDLSGHGDNPRLMLALSKIVQQRAEPGSLEGNAGGKVDPMKLSIGQAKAALENLENDPIKGPALRDNSHSMHKSVLAERTRLARMAEGMNPDD